jgi:hypothetical protein
MDNGIRLKKQGIWARMAQHPVGTLLGGVATALLCGLMGSFNGSVVAVVMATLGAIVGAPLGAMPAASGQHSP